MNILSIKLKLEGDSTIESEPNMQMHAIRDLQVFVPNPFLRVSISTF